MEELLIATERQISLQTDRYALLVCRSCDILSHGSRVKRGLRILKDFYPWRPGFRTRISQATAYDVEGRLNALCECFAFLILGENPENPFGASKCSFPSSNEWLASDPFRALTGSCLIDLQVRTNDNPVSFPQGFVHILRTANNGYLNDVAPSPWPQWTCNLSVPLSLPCSQPSELGT